MIRHRAQSTCPWVYWIALIGAIVGLSAPPAHAQATTASQLVWNQVAVDEGTAANYTYTYDPDGAATGTVLAPVACNTDGVTIACSAPMPAFTPGAHALTLTASNAAGESPHSTPISFTFVVVPDAPTSLRIQ